MPVPFYPRTGLLVLLGVLLCMTWLGQDETRLEEACTRYVPTAACQKL